MVSYVTAVGESGVNGQQSDAGGSIPRWVQNMAIPGQIFNDGKKFVEYVRKQPAANGIVNGIVEK